MAQMLRARTNSRVVKTSAPAVISVGARPREGHRPEISRTSKGREPEISSNNLRGKCYSKKAPK